MGWVMERFMVSRSVWGVGMQILGQQKCSWGGRFMVSTSLWVGGGGDMGCGNASSLGMVSGRHLTSLAPGGGAGRGCTAWKLWKLWKGAGGRKCQCATTRRNEGRSLGHSCTRRAAWQSWLGLSQHMHSLTSVWATYPLQEARAAGAWRDRMESRALSAWRSYADSARTKQALRARAEAHFAARCLSMQAWPAWRAHVEERRAKKRANALAQAHHARCLLASGMAGLRCERRCLRA